VRSKGVHMRIPENLVAAVREQAAARRVPINAI
jgi:predicted DNA binding CopG/RHH family protein